MRPSSSTSCSPAPILPLFMKTTAGLALAQVHASFAAVASVAAYPGYALLAAETPAKICEAKAKAAAVVEVAELLAGPYLHGPVAVEGALSFGPPCEGACAPSWPMMLSTEPSLSCIRARKSSSHFASSRMSGTPLPDSGMLVLSVKAEGFSW